MCMSRQLWPHLSLVRSLVQGENSHLKKSYIFRQFGLFPNWKTWQFRYGHFLAREKFENEFELMSKRFCICLFCIHILFQGYQKKILVLFFKADNIINHYYFQVMIFHTAFGEIKNENLSAMPNFKIQLLHCANF
jgi:hypothetical protein